MKKIDKKVLIVEDDEDFLFILQKVFASSGFTVITAKDGESAINVATKENPDLIISDVLMPRLDGHSMAKRLKDLKNSTPILFLTNVENKDENIKKTDYLIKSKLHLTEIVERAKKKLKVE